MKSIGWGFFFLLCISCVTEKSSTSITDFSVGVHSEPVDSLRRIDSWLFQDSLIWIATSNDGSQILFTVDSVLWCTMYNHQHGKYESVNYSHVQSSYYPDSLWNIQSQDSELRIIIKLKCDQPLKYQLVYKKRTLENFKLELLIPSRYHDIYVLQKYNQQNLRDWKNFTHQVTFEMNSTEQYMMMYGKCGNYKIPFQYVANNYFCLGKSTPTIIPCHVFYSEVELAVSIQQRLVEIKREGMYLKLVVPGDTLTFLKID